MKINSGLWKPDVPSPLLPILKYDFLFAMKIWNLMVGEIASGHYAQCPRHPEQISKLQSDRPLIPDWQPGGGPQYTVQGAHSTQYSDNGRVFILVTALTISTGHTAATAGCGEHIMGVGRCYATIIVCGHAPLVPGYWHVIMEFIKNSKQTCKCQKFWKNVS